VLCQVPVDWFNNMLQCMKQKKPACQLVAVDRTAYQTLGKSDAKLLLSPSCKQLLSDWQRISVIAIEKQSTHVVRSALKHIDLIVNSLCQFLPCDVMQSMVMPQYIVCVCPSITFVYVSHTGWNTSKIISWPNSLRYLLRLTPWM